MQGAFNTALELVPEGIRKSLESLGERERRRAEEIRLRTGFPAGVLLPEGERRLGNAVTAGDIAHVLDRASRSSLHAVQHELRRGFLCARGGLRIGVCGTMAGETLRDYSSLALRLPHEVRGAGAEIMGELRPFESSILIISPPGGGKTTFLRELIRNASESGRRVSLCDERGEVAAMWQGRAAFDLGPCTDVLSGAPKAEGVMALLRAMNPQIIALDEISAGADGAALEQAASCGAAVFATAHGAGVEEVRRRPHYARIFEMGIFQKAVVIGADARRSYRVVEL